jgi:hypothetical protein
MIKKLVITGKVGDRVKMTFNDLTLISTKYKKDIYVLPIAFSEHDDYDKNISAIKSMIVVMNIEDEIVPPVISVI